MTTEETYRILTDDRLKRTVSYYPPGELDPRAIVITQERVSDEVYEGLASGALRYDTRIVVEEN